MKVELDKTFPLQGSADVGWTFLQNIEAVAGCMPGAKITERLPSGAYKGTVTVRAGPATMSFRGELEVRDVDPAARSLRLLGKGTDTTGSSGASMTLLARIDAVSDTGSRLVGRSEVTMSGKAAAFGGRMMDSIADQVLAQFAENFGAQVRALAATQAATTGSSVAGLDSTSSSAASSSSASSPAASPNASPTPAPSPAASELNALALVWRAFKHWLCGLFRRSSA